MRLKIRVFLGLTLVFGVIFGMIGPDPSFATRVVIRPRPKPIPKSLSSNSHTRVIYPKRTELDFEGIRLEGELRNPGEFYFQYRPEEKFDSLVQRRKNFHREMLRDVVLTK